MSLRERLTERGKGDGSQPGFSLQAVQGQVHGQIVARFAAEARGDGDGIPTVSVDPEQMLNRVKSMAEDLLEADHPTLSPSECSWVISGVCDDILAFGPISPLLADPEITEVMVNGPGQVYVERTGRIEKTPITFRDTAHVMAVIDKILAPLGRRIDESSPMVDARLPDGSRVNAVIPPVCLHGPSITIRKFRAEGYDMSALIALGALTAEMARFLQCCVESKLNMIVTGGTASGKTTTLNALSAFIPSSERIITIEDAAELQLRQGHVLGLESRPPNVEGRGEVTIRDLLRNALRMRPDRIVIGEVRGGEALDLLQAMNTGHDGCLSTLHANRPRDAIARLETLALMAKLDLPVRVIRQQIAAAVDLIVHQERFEDGTRRITNITEVHGMEGDVITLQDVFFYERSGVSADGRVQGRVLRSALRPAALQVFTRFGIAQSCWVSEGEGVGRQ